MKVIKAYDGGADNNAGTIEDNTTRVVEWNININAYANINEKIVLDRTDQKPLTPKVLTSEHWLAWEDGIEVQDMQRVVWATYQYSDASNALISDTGWISFDRINNQRKIWTGSGWSTNSLASIYDPIKKIYVPIR